MDTTKKRVLTDKILSDIEKTGKEVKKIYSEEKEITDQDGKKILNPDYDEKDFELKVTDVIPSGGNYKFLLA